MLIGYNYTFNFGPSEQRIELMSGQFADFSTFCSLGSSRNVLLQEAWGGVQRF